MKIVISAGHGKYVAGAVGPAPWGLSEHEEAVRTMSEVANWLTLHGYDVATLVDTVCTTQDANLKWIVSHHNEFPAADRLDCSIHFNAYLETSGARGTECLYLTQDGLAARISAEIASASGLINRGAKYRSDLYFLNKTTGSLGAVLVEVCFVDAAQDVECYDQSFDKIAAAIGIALTRPADAVVPFHAIGKVSHFGGPEDTGVSSSENLAWWEELDDALEDAPELFLSYQPTGTTGLARRLDPQSSYIAMRWDYNQFSKEDLASGDIVFWVHAPKTGKRYKARPADWGPASDAGTGGRVADISPGLMAALGIETDDEVEITLV